MADEEWHPDQIGAFDGLGRYILEVPYHNPTELMMDILRHGAACEVLAPETLREAVRRELVAAVRGYAASGGIAEAHQD